jgi:hypothetical protein
MPKRLGVVVVVVAAEVEVVVEAPPVGGLAIALGKLHSPETQSCGWAATTMSTLGWTADDHTCSA